jgi:uncharacterized protein
MRFGVMIGARIAAFALAALLATACAAFDAARAPAFAQTPPASSHASAAQLFIIIYRPGPAWRVGVPMQEQGLRPHALYLSGLLDAGRLFAAGPFGDEPAGGLVIVRAAGLAEARALMDADPAVVSGLFVGELRPWTPRFRTDEPLPLTN